MSVCVVDANVALKWFVPQPDSERALASLQRFSFLAPDLILAEVANGLWKYVRAGILTGSLAQDILGALKDGYFLAEPVDDALAADALALAVDAGHPVYDCLYVALARRRKIPFLTADRRLVARIAPLGLVEAIDLHTIEPEGT
ncbi:putative nucleic acid-binding protein [Rhodobium orientis]|uniref:Ribonuclease VapC n=1 Tax=Rhodobium orientis TaxID=34017 RepID=A0A327JRZ5_9HYPH|nr:type II toxin-antitoxin system VapC family toxin [Rhodobium orientis]MBB4301759.1 putative nucleic acid-binding protein [Rhodobium orientis]MBK5950561.1 hypothetical protein [Rhodobium orientis]RAI28203.1 hypothetical protein CH339_07615 [Rhodobium orientis]